MAPGARGRRALGSKSLGGEENSPGIRQVPPPSQWPPGHRSALPLQAPQGSDPPHRVLPPRKSPAQPPMGWVTAEGGAPPEGVGAAEWGHLRKFFGTSSYLSPSPSGLVLQA